MTVRQYEKVIARFAARNARIRDLRRRGWKLNAIAKRHGITKQRVSQICDGIGRVGRVGAS